MDRNTPRRYRQSRPADALRQLSAEDVQAIRRFFQDHSSRQGALNDETHTVGAEVLGTIQQPTLVVHSGEDRAVPFSHAEWPLAHIADTELVESGCTGHLFWAGPDFERVSASPAAFFKAC